MRAFRLDAQAPRSGLSVMRSLLFVPGGSAAMLEKAPRSGSDALILDLEDAVHPQGKDQARGLVAQALSDRRAGHPSVYVRVNGLETRWCEDDLRAVLPGRPAGIVLPKPRGPQDLLALAGLIDRWEPPGSGTGIIAICTETAEGTLSLMSRSWAHPRLHGLMWGGEDLSAALQGTSSRMDDGAYAQPMALARSLCLLAARAAGVRPIDAVFVSHGDDAGLLAEVHGARRDGFGAKAAIHPRQIAVIHRGFAPTAAETAWAAEVVAAVGQEDGGVAVVDGQMVDAPHLKRAQAILDDAARVTSRH